MKRFLFKATLFSGFLALTILVVFLNEGGYSDPFYLRFTTPKQASLIIGTSKAAQGLMPSILNEQLGSVSKYPIFNYAFTIFNSPYGEAYFSSIRRKLLETQDGIFIVTVDPWSVAAVKGTKNDEDELPESKNFLANISNVSINPNLEYLLNFYPKHFANIVRRRIRPTNRILHYDGWLEINVRMDSTVVAKRTRQKIEQYEPKIGKSQISAIRLNYFVKTIEYLKQHGRVFVVRLPVSAEMLSIEDRAMPDFTAKIDSVCRHYQVPSFDLTKRGEEYNYTDGNHLHKSSAKDVSMELAKLIMNSGVR